MQHDRMQEDRWPSAYYCSSRIQRYYTINKPPGDKASAQGKKTKEKETKKGNTPVKHQSNTSDGGGRPTLAVF